ncbi:MAG: helix-turn-helix transcriptional regulator [Candidatus Gastranaerophilaceae bacterium]
MQHNDIHLKLGNKIKYERMKRHWSQEKLAEASDLSMRSISLLECGKNDVRFSTLSKLAKAFDMEVSALVDFRL